MSAGPLANLLLAVLLYASAHWIGIEEPQAILGTPAAGSLAESAGLRAGDRVQAVSADGDTWRDVPSMPDLRWQITQAALDGKPLQLRVTDRQGHGARTATLDLQRLDVRDVDAQLMRQIGLGPAFSEPRLGKVNAGGAADAAGLRQGDHVHQHRRRAGRRRAGAGASASAPRSQGDARRRTALARRPRRAACSTWW